jgi:hypothetical protein
MAVIPTDGGGKRHTDLESAEIRQSAAAERFVELANAPAESGCGATRDPDRRH